MVKLRFMRIGKKNRPYYRLCAVEGRRQRDGEYLELVGIYDPLIRDDLKKIRLDKERIEYWISKGAQPTEGVYPFLKKAHVAGLIKPKKPRHARPKPQPKTAAAVAAAAAASGKVSTRKPKPPKKPRPPKGSKTDGAGGPEAAPPA
jgi:small subunit ribosomal protein S16